MQDIFEYRQEGVDADGKIRGDFRATGVRPRCAARIERAGYSIAGGLAR